MNTHAWILLAVYVVVYLLVYPVTLYYQLVLIRTGPVAEEEGAPAIAGLQRSLPARAAAGAVPEPQP